MADKTLEQKIKDLQNHGEVMITGNEVWVLLDEVLRLVKDHERG